MQKFTATFEDKFEYNSRFVLLSFELKNPFRMEFQAGQYIKLKVSETLEKEYFIFSSPDVNHGFKILVDKSIVGEATSYLENMTLGDVVEFTAPHGEFILDDQSEGELVLVATSVGVAPFHSMVLDLLQAKQSKRKITLFWGLDKLEDFFLYEDLELLSKNFPNFDFHPVMAEALPEWTLCRGTVYDCLSIHEVNIDAMFYICVNDDISSKMKELFLANQVREEQIKIANYN